MIFGDKNRRLLVTDQHVIISRSNSALKFQNDFSREFIQRSFKHPKVFKSKVYDYVDGKLFSLQNNESKDVNIQNVIDFIKIDKEFFFIKNENEIHTICQMDGKIISEIGSMYFVESPYIFSLYKNSIIRLNLNNKEKTTVSAFESDSLPLIFCTSTTDDTIIAYSDRLNKIHIKSNKVNRMYHWMSNKILYMIMNDDYVLAVSKSGDVARFHINIQRIEPLFKFDGSFIDSSCMNNRVYLLSNFEFIVFDLTTNNIIFKDILIEQSNFKVSSLNKYIKDDTQQKEDMFDLKKQSTIEIHNMIDLKYNPSDYEYQVSYSSGNFLFVVDTKTMNVVSQFKIENSFHNFVSGNNLISFILRKSNIICQIFDIFTDKMVLSRTFTFSWKGKFAVKDVFIVNERLFVLIANTLYSLNKMNILEVIKEDVSRIKYTRDRLFLIDEKGIFNPTTRSYDIKQKKVLSCTLLNGKVIFYIDEMGIFCDLPERKQIFEIKDVIDMESRIIKKDKSLQEVLKVLYLVNGHYTIAVFTEENDKLIKIEEYAVDNISSRILTDETQASKTNMLLTLTKEFK